MVVNKLLLIDCDGVLTDNTYFLNESGEKFKRFNCADHEAISLLKSKGWDIYILSNSSFDLSPWVDNRGVTWIRTQGNKMDIVSAILKGRGGLMPSYCAVGNSQLDHEMLRQAQFGYCPADACKDLLRDSSIHRLDTKGGEGVIEELARRLLSLSILR